MRLRLWIRLLLENLFWIIWTNSTSFKNNVDAAKEMKRLKMGWVAASATGKDASNASDIECAIAAYIFMMAECVRESVRD